MRSPLGELHTLRLDTYHSKNIIFFPLFRTFQLDKLGYLGVKVNPHECPSPGPESVAVLVKLASGSSCLSVPLDQLICSLSEDDFQSRGSSQCVSSCS